MFWRRKKKTGKNIEGDLFQYMVNKQHVSLDVLHNLRIVERDAVVGDKPVGLTMFRIFNPFVTDEKGVSIDVATDDYESLDNHPELVLYEGYYREVGGQATDIHIEKK